MKDRDDTDVEDLIGYDAVEPGLPPASSDRRKWWLDNGLPARSTVQSPGKNFVPNPQRVSNPFKPTTEPEWVRIQQSQNVGSQPERDNSPGRAPSVARRSAAVARKVPPPYIYSGDNISSTSLSSLPPQLTNRSQHPFSPVPLIRSSSHSSTQSLPISTPIPRKAAPPVPRKPRQVSSPSVSPTSERPQSLSLSRNSSVGSTSLQFQTRPKVAPSPPPPRRGVASIAQQVNRTMSDAQSHPWKARDTPPTLVPAKTTPRAAQSSKSVDNSTSRPRPPVGPKPVVVSPGFVEANADDQPPSLPPRRGTGLLDDEDDAGPAGLRAWQVLERGRR